MLKLAGQRFQEELVEHEAELDAHMGDLFQHLRTGEYIYNLPVNFFSNLALVADRLYATPLVVARSLSLDRLAIEVTTAGAGSKVARLGLYRDGANLYPSSLLLDAGAVAVDTTGVKAVAVSQPLSKGLYWLACISDGTPIVRAVIYSFSPLGHSAASFSDLYCQTHYRKDGVGAGALPDPFPSAAELRIDYSPMLLGRLQSLD